MDQLKEFDVRVNVSLSGLFTVEANTEEEAKQIAQEMFINNEIFPDERKSEFFESVSFEIE